MISTAATVTEFLASLPPGERQVLAKIRTLFKRAHPKATESMKYRMPTYLVGDEMAGAFNRQKNHFALYVGKDAITACRAKLKAAGLDCGGGCVRFRRPDQLPLRLAEKLIQASTRRA